MRATKLQKYGWVPDLPDHRDIAYLPKVEELKQTVDMRNVCPIVVDQGQLGSCVGNGVSSLYQIREIQQGKQYYSPALRGKVANGDFVFAPSRLFVYYGARSLEGTTDQDSGCEIRDAIKFVANNGVCTSKTWPYHVGKFAIAPPAAAYTEAKARGMLLQYSYIDNSNLLHLLAALSAGNPFALGISVYDSFESDYVARTGIVPMPKRNESLLGGHCVVCVGFDAHKKLFLCRNSWGPDWGQGGYFWIPFSYLTNLDLANDFWTITKVE